MQKFRWFVFASVTSLVLYFGIRFYLYFVHSTGIVNILFASLLLFAEGHSLIHALGFLLGVFRLQKTDANSYRRVKLDRRSLPSVTVLVPARNEPLYILEATFITLTSLDYSQKKIVFLDGSDEEYLKQNQALAEKYLLTYFHPTQPSKSKAEIINRYLPQVQSVYVSVFDADQNPMPEFLMELVALLEYSRNIAFVQTPQLYSNLQTSPIARAAGFQQSIFYENVCEAKGTVDAMFCCGTNFLMRTDVLKEVDGFDDSSVTEDFATSVKIHALGYHSIYYNHVRVFGLAPETFPAYLKQQYRWSFGSISVLLVLVKAWKNVFRLNSLSLSLSLSNMGVFFVGNLLFCRVVVSLSHHKSGILFAV